MDDRDLLDLLVGRRLQPVFVCEIDKGVSNLVGAATNRVHLSRETVEKQHTKHFSEGHRLFQKSPVVLTHGFARIESENHIIFILNDDEADKRRSYKAVVKITRDRNQLFLVSIHRVEAGGVRAVFKKTLSIEEWEFVRREVGPPKNPT